VRTLVVPTVSAANVPQLAVDLLVHTHALARVATVVDAAVMPAVGADALGTGAQSLSTACEIYCDAAGGVAVLQLRAPLAPGTGPAVKNEGGCRHRSSPEISPFNRAVR
jgi:hypothetical protein